MRIPDENQSAHSIALNGSVSFAAECRAEIHLQKIPFFATRSAAGAPSDSTSDTFNWPAQRRRNQKLWDAFAYPVITQTDVMRAVGNSSRQWESRAIQENSHMVISQEAITIRPFSQKDAQALEQLKQQSTPTRNLWASWIREPQPNDVGIVGYIGETLAAACTVNVALNQAQLDLQLGVQHPAVEKWFPILTMVHALGHGTLANEMAFEAVRLAVLERAIEARINGKRFSFQMGSGNVPRSSFHYPTLYKLGYASYPALNQRTKARYTALDNATFGKARDGLRKQQEEGLIPEYANSPVIRFPGDDRHIAR